MEMHMFKYIPKVMYKLWKCQAILQKAIHFQLNTGQALYTTKSTQETKCRCVVCDKVYNQKDDLKWQPLASI